jgi:hypothetical protein
MRHGHRNRGLEVVAEIEVEVAGAGAGAADATAGRFYLGQIVKKGEDRSGLPPFYFL